MNQTKLYENFKPMQGYECLNSCLTNYLNIWGIHVDPSIIYFCGEGFNIKFIKSNNLHIITTSHKSNFDFMRKYGITFDKIKENSEKSKSQLIRMLEDNHSISLKVLSSSLNYNRVFSQNDSIHFINAIGISSDKNKVFVVDGYVPTLKPSTFSGWVDIDDIVQAWSRAEGEYIEFQKPEMMNLEVIYSDYISALKNQLGSYISKTGSSDGLFYGYLALIELFHELTNCPSKQMAEVTRDINYQIRIQGVIASRYFIKRAVNLILNNAEMCEKIDGFIEKWNSISLMLIKASFSGKRDYLKIIYEKVEKVLYDENRLINVILGMLD